MTAIEAVEDTLDDIARAFTRLADRLWDEGRRRRVAGELTREEYAELKDHCRALSRRSVELITSSSRKRLEALAGDRAQLEKITADLGVVQARVESVASAVGLAVAVVGAVSLVVAAVAAPSPQTIGQAVAGVARIVESAVAVHDA